MIGVSGNPPVAMSGNSRRLALDRGSNCRKRLHCLMLEHGARRDHQPRLPRPAHQLDRNDAVPAQRKEIVRNPHPGDPEKT